MPKFKKNKQKNSLSLGFSLIELLVVIAIIGLLSSVVLVSINKTRAKARDSKRVADLQQIMKALELYYSDHQSIPSCSDPGYVGGCDLTGWPTASSSLDTSLDGHFMEFLVSGGYISAIPKDPLNQFNGGSGNFYILTQSGAVYPTGSGQSYLYLIGARLEDPKSPALANSLTANDPAFSGSYVVGMHQ